MADIPVVWNHAMNVLFKIHLFKLSIHKKVFENNISYISKTKKNHNHKAQDTEMSQVFLFLPKSLHCGHRPKCWKLIYIKLFYYKVYEIKHLQHTYICFFSFLHFIIWVYVIKDITKKHEVQVGSEWFFYKKRVLINISGIFCKRHEFLKFSVLKLFSNLYLK